MIDATTTAKDLAAAFKQITQTLKDCKTEDGCTERLSFVLRQIIISLVTLKNLTDVYQHLPSTEVLDVLRFAFVFLFLSLLTLFTPSNF